MVYFTNVPTGDRPWKVYLREEGGIGELVEALASRHGLDPAFVKAVIAAESAFDPRATSPKGAMGLMQLMPSTADKLGVRDPFDPEQNVEAGIRYLKALIGRFHGDLSMALAAYNAGPEAVRRWGGIPPYQETRRYVATVLRLYEEFRGER